MHQGRRQGQDRAIQHKSSIAVQDADFDATAKSKLRTVLLETQKLRYRLVRPACAESAKRE
ncbi:hypothetical protein CBM2589_B130047 [Cupriavidus taiwanensis]|uniref:Uncharacterized protein n=1 Tax=Cupriavidus taiwanensis TaxID=164546 RepID=A0A975WVJ8_9BURK|nr:hypothetical protein CBM2589_B130047 [Cupriavidus taiwanensis]